VLLIVCFHMGINIKSVCQLHHCDVGWGFRLLLLKNLHNYHLTLWTIQTQHGQLCYDPRDLV
jgi:hypothetical protein